jgi:hypothetical protein
MPITKTSSKKEVIKDMPKKKASYAGTEEKKVASKQAASTRANVSSTKESTQRPRSKLDKLGGGDASKSSGKNSVKNISFKDGKKVEKLSGRGTEIDNKTLEKRSKREMKDVLRARAKDEAKKFSIAEDLKLGAKHAISKAVVKSTLNKAVPVIGAIQAVKDIVAYGKKSKENIEKSRSMKRPTADKSLESVKSSTNTKSAARKSYEAQRKKK